jgi:alpha-galactosidase
MPSRRDFIENTLRRAAGLLLVRHDVTQARLAPAAPRAGFLNILRSPDLVVVQSESTELRLVASSGDRWVNGDVVVTTSPESGALRVRLSAPATPVKRVHLRWRGRLADVRLILGDAWERGYGDLEWRGWAPDRAMPWYVATTDGSVTHAYGVRTRSAAFCFWQLDPGGVSLWADVRSGGVGVRLGERLLNICDVVSRPGRPGESAFAAVHAFCAQMCPTPRLPARPVYGHNDWYWAYGNNSAETVLADARHIVELSPTGTNRPFAVIDDGWQPGRGRDAAGAGTWDHGNEKFPDMAALASSIGRVGARPGIWIRPLQAPADAPDGWRLTRDRDALDPTVPDVRHKIVSDIRRIGEWGFELIKHDYTTYDVFGRWGFQMGTALTRDGWTFASGPARTTAEVIDDLYADIRSAAGNHLVIGCNTVSHLSAGHFEICRIGDDTSGTEWPRTRKMGVNTLAFRGAQHGAFYVADADCVGVTNAIPWALNRQWLDLVARSGTMLFVSAAPDAIGAPQRRDLTAALALASMPQPLGEPLDWQRTVTPSRWRLAHRERTYDWVGAGGPGLG